MNRNEPKNILTIQTAYLGDVVLTTPLLMRIRERFPAARTSVMVVPRTKDIVQGHPAVDEVLTYDKKAKHGQSAGLRWIIRELQARQFDLCVLPHQSFRSGLLAWWAGIPRRVGFANSPGGIFYTDRVPREKAKHEVDRLLELLHPFISGDVGSMAPRVMVSGTARESVDRVLKENGIQPGELMVGMAPGSVWETKRWLSDGFADVADRLVQNHGARIVLLGSKEEEPIARSIISASKIKIVDLMGQSLNELVATLSRCRLLITNDKPL